MSIPISIGTQSFEKIREARAFYIDKTLFIKEWWESKDDVTLITRPRRFGKTLNMSMLECFFPLNIPKDKTFLKDFPYGRKKSIGKYRELIL